MMDPHELAKVPPGLPRLRYMMRRHPFELLFWLVGIVAVCYFLFVWIPENSV